MTREEEREKIKEYIRKVYDERKETPSVREINAVLGHNSHSYLHNHFVTIDEACLEAEVEPDLIRSRKTEAASLQRLRLQKRARAQQQKPTIDLRLPEQVEIEDEEDEPDFGYARFLECPSCRGSLHWDEDNELLCPTCERYVGCSHGRHFLFSRAIDLAMAPCGCQFYARYRRNRASDNLRYDPDDDTLKPYPPWKPSGYFTKYNGDTTPL